MLWIVILILKSDKIFHVKFDIEYLNHYLLGI